MSVINMSMINMSVINMSVTNKTTVKADGGNLARRDVLKSAATVAAAAGFGLAETATATSAQAEAASANAPLPPPMPGYQSLGRDEAAFVEALVNLMCPADNLTPNGVDCGLAVYIDRQLAGAFGRGDRLYRSGPWLQGRPELGYQLPLAPEAFFKAGISAVNADCRRRFGKAFDALTANDANAVLKELGDGKISDPEVPLGLWFNGLVYPLFVQACFADPIYGGNNGKIFWRMIGYPGLPATHGRDMTAFRGKPYPGAGDPQSIADFS
jgi:gluconate 2-dehydrogenase gamma chain